MSELKVTPKPPRAKQATHSRELVSTGGSAGSFTLLERPINSSVKNKAYGVKREEYKLQHTDMKQTAQIVAEYDAWGIEEIQHRAAMLADFVNNRWKHN